MADVSSPLLCICKYFCCHLHAKLVAFDEGVFLRQSDQRKPAVLDLRQLIFLLFVSE